MAEALHRPPLPNPVTTSVCATQDEIEEACIGANEPKYRQTEDTNFMVDPLVRDLGYRDAYLNAEGILAGTYPVPDVLSGGCKRLIAKMRMLPETADSPCPDYITTESHVDAWQKARENTTAGKSGLHFGMFKAQARDPDITAFDASQCSVAYKTGHVFKQWKLGIDYQLLKCSNAYRVEKL